MTTTPDRDAPPVPATTQSDDQYPHEFVGDPADAPANPSPAEVAAALEQLEGLQLREVDLPGLVGAPGWRLAGALEQLRAEADAANPNRDRSSDGTIGDTAHAARVSDHNPNAAGVVRALDLDVDGLDLPTVFERARQLAAAGQLPQLAGGGYLILNRRITAPDFTRWNVYTGPNPHISHGHASASRSAAEYDARTPWGVFGAAPVAPRPPAAPTGPGWTGPDLTGSRATLRGDVGNNGPRVEALQRWLAATFPAYRHALGGNLIAADGWWGDESTAWLRYFAHRCGIGAADGRNIGPRLAAALAKYGFRG